MDLVLGVPTRDAHYESPQEVPGLHALSLPVRTPGRTPKPVPEGFEVAIVGAGPAGISMAVQLGRLGVPYVLYDRRDEIGGTWSIHKYPDIRVDTLSLTYEFSFDDQYPGRSTSRAVRTCGVISSSSSTSTACVNISGSLTISKMRVSMRRLRPGASRFVGPMASRSSARRTWS